MAFMAPLLAENRPFLMSGYWTHQVLCKDAAQRWRTFAGIKSVLAGHGLNELSESRLGDDGNLNLIFVPKFSLFYFQVVWTPNVVTVSYAATLTLLVLHSRYGGKTLGIKVQ